MPSLTAVVTGAAGFLGRAVVRALRDDPSVKGVVALDRRPDGVEGVRWVRADVRDPDLHRHLEADVVVHLAFVVLGDLREAEDVNVRGSANTFRAAARAGCHRIVFASSVAAYGLGLPDRLLTEDDPLHPLASFTYSRTKGAVERVLDDIQLRNPDLEVVRLRPAIVLGPGIHPPLLVWARSRVHVRPGRRAGPIQFVHLDDVVEACRLAVVGGATGAFNVAGDGAVSYERLARLAGARLVAVPAGLARGALGVGARVRPSAGLDPGWLEIARRPPVVSSERARRELGWTPSRTTEEAVREFFALARHRDGDRSTAPAPALVRGGH